MRADAVLRCVAVALEYDGWSPDEPDYAEAIGVARLLVSQSIERLESHSDASTASSASSEGDSIDTRGWGSNLLGEAPRIAPATVASDLEAVEQLALGLAEEARELLAVSLLDSLPSVLSYKEDSVGESAASSQAIDLMTRPVRSESSTEHEEH
jgi:hypothetical protein